MGLECEVDTEYKLLVCRECIRTAGLRVSTLELAVIDNDAGIIGGSIYAEAFDEGLAGQLLRQCVAESDVLNLGKRTVNYAESRIELALFASCAGARIVSALIALCPVVSAGKLVLGT